MDYSPRVVEDKIDMSDQYSYDEVIQILKNVGIDADCGVCMCQAFTGSAHGCGKHTCRNYSDGERWRLLVSLAGHVHDGSSTIIKVFWDDATGNAFIKIGKDYYLGKSFEEALEEAVKSLTGEAE